MSVDLLLPCIRISAILRPGDPNEPTDLESAALYYIRHYNDVRGTSPRELESFLGLGSAVFQDMLIRMINRGWLKVYGMPRRLFLSEKVRAILDRPGSSRARELQSTEEGKRFSVCYDLLGGGFAVIPDRFLSRSMDDVHAVPRQSPEAPTAPYGKPLNGFLEDDAQFRESRDARILQALHRDRMARQYLQGVKRGSAPHLHVPKPGGMLTYNDILFFRCRFDVHSAPDGSSEETLPPILECVEQRNRSVRRLGELNADKIIDCATAASLAGDSRFLKALRRNEGQRAKVYGRSSDPFQGLVEKLAAPDGDQSFEDVFELWDLVVDRIEMLLASRIDFAASRAVPPEDHRSVACDLVRTAEERIVVSSPLIRVRSPEWATDVETVPSVLAELASGQADIDMLVHGVTGMTTRGMALSDDVAVTRLVTALGSDHVNVVDQSLDHLRTAFVLTDDDGFLWQTGSLLGDHGPRALLLRLACRGAQNTIRRASQIFPPALRDRIEARAGPAAPPAPAGRQGWPPHIAASARDVEDMLARTSAADLSDVGRRATFLEDLKKQADFISSWLINESDSVELVAGATIRDRAGAMVGPDSDSVPLVIGISGPVDISAFTDLAEEIGHRLSRQDVVGIAGIPTFICIPDGLEYEVAATRFATSIGSIEGRCELLRQPARADRSRPAGFVLSPSSALLTQDGLARFVPTAGRKVKGTHLGILLHGQKARELAAEFLRQEWPECAAWFGGSAPEIRQRTPPMSEFRREQLVNRARSEAWLDDGNRGANRAGFAIRSAETGSTPVWAGRLSDALVLLAADAMEQRACGYALLKAVALAENTGEISAIGALGELARHVRRDRNLLATAIFADHLPEGSVYRDPLTRKLALCVARRLAPSLTADEQAELQNPSRSAQCLACILLMDGLGGDLSDWLAYMEPSQGDDELSSFTRALAAYVRENGPSTLDLNLFKPDGAAKGLDDWLEQLRQHAAGDRTRRTVRLPPQVEALRDLIFEKEGSFPADIFRVADRQWDGRPEDERIKALREFFKQAAGDLGVDLYEAGRASGRSVRIDRLAEEYFDRKNEQMQRQSGQEPVLKHLAGRNMVTSLKTILGLVVNGILPAMIGATNQAERALCSLAGQVLTLPPPDPDGEEAALMHMLAARLRDVGASLGMSSPVWEVPRLPNPERPDWPRLRIAFLKSEFARGTSFHAVVNWFLEADRAAESDLTGRWDGSGEILPLLHDLLDSSAGICDARDCEHAREALDRHLSEIVREVRSLIADAAAFAKVVESADDSLDEAIRDTERSLDVLCGHIDDRDVMSAVILADDLRKVQRKELIECWRRISAAVLEDVGKDSAAPIKEELRRHRERPIRAEELVEAQLYVQVAPSLSKPIPFNVDLQLDVGEGLEPATDLGGADELIRFLAATRRGRGHAGSDASHPVASPAAVLSFFSGLPEQELLPQMTTDSEMRRVKCWHPQIAALTFGTSESAEFVLPITRDAELNLREKLRTTHSSQLAPSSGGFAGLGGAAYRRDARSEILLSLYFNEAVPGIPVLGWRYLAQLGALPVRDRRVATLSEIWRQGFGGAEKVQSWWAERRDNGVGLLCWLLGLGGDAPDARFSDEDLAAHVRDLGLIFGLFVERSPIWLKLSQHGLAKLTQIWLEIVGPFNSVRRHDAQVLTHFMDGIIKIASQESRG